MVITDILPQKRYTGIRSSIFIDGKYFCGLMNETVVKEKLAIGNNVDKDKLEQVQFESEKLWALDKAFGYISYKMRSKKEVEKYLADKGFLQNVIDFCTQQLTGYRYVDDEQLSNAMVEEFSKKGGKHLIKDKLFQKGIDREVIEQVMQEFEEDDEAAYNLIEKYLNGKEKDRKSFDKAIRYLTSKGFTWDTIKNALSRYKEFLSEEFN